MHAAQHHFLKLLHDTTRRRDDGTERSILRRVFTQNIDTLEQQVGLPDEVLVSAHGSFGDAHCIQPECRRQMLLPAWRAAIEAGKAPVCDVCGGLVKPDIVFFGESLPSRFGELMLSDFEDGSVDLLLVLGTSLTVAPFNSLLRRVPLSVPRVLINRFILDSAFIVHRAPVGRAIYLCSIHLSVYRAELRVDQTVHVSAYLSALDVHC